MNGRLTRSDATGAVKRKPRRASVSGWLLTIALVIGGVAGCGDRGPDRIAVEGSVSLDGVPVDDATIVFRPVAEGGLAAAAAIKQGKFAFTANDGPTAGNHHVQINPNEPELDDIEADPSQLRERATARIPAIYQRPGALEAAVEENPVEPLTFELSPGPR